MSGAAKLLMVFSWVLPGCMAQEPTTPAPAPQANASMVERKLEPPPPAHAAFEVSATGVQIYRCTQNGDSAQWTFVAPEATLHEAGVQGPASGSHGAGPSWRWNDGSALTGTLVAKHNAPTPESIPWLLLSTAPAVGSRPGRLTGITYVRRDRTIGGMAPSTGCDKDHLNQQARVPYTAQYTFFR